nr:carboxylesterase/lipase family protein [Hyphomonas sp. Mor2]
MAEVTISHGRIAGSEAEGVYSFKGIPFAAPISGENRWRNPRPREPWSGVRDATEFGEICPQQPSPIMWLSGSAGKKFLQTIDVPGTHGDDCLNLNVWTPTLDPQARLPVMVWIHGGAFVSGSGSHPIYHGHNLAKKEVVIVSVNYRLGLMGSFVAPGMFEDDFCGPNRGFEDQLAGLRWVQENVAQFGGDPGNVTIFGESAGGQSIAVLLASPAAQGLYHRAIAQSGTPEICGSIKGHEQYSRDLLDALKIKHGDREAISALSGADTVKIMGKARKLLARKDAEERYGDLVIHGNIGCVHGTDFMPVHLLDSLKQGVAKDKDLMIGSVLEDGRLFQLAMPGPEWFSAWATMGLFKNLIIPRQKVKQVFESYKRAMPGAKGSYVRGQIITDALFRRGTVRAAEIHAETAPGRTYLYQFNWSSPVKGIGAVHGMEIPFCNLNLEAFEKCIGDPEPLREMADMVSDAWVSFARTGKPSASMPDWAPFDPERRATMVFDTKTELQNDVDRHLRDIWYGEAN